MPLLLLAALSIEGVGYWNLLRLARAGGASQWEGGIVFCVGALFQGGFRGNQGVVRVGKFYSKGEVELAGALR